MRVRTERKRGPTDSRSLSFVRSSTCVQHLLLIQMSRRVSVETGPEPDRQKRKPLSTNGTQDETPVRQHWNQRVPLPWVSPWTPFQDPEHPQVRLGPLSTGSPSRRPLVLNPSPPRVPRT